MYGEVTVLGSRSRKPRGPPSCCSRLGARCLVAWSWRGHLALPYAPNFIAVNLFLLSLSHLRVCGVTSAHNRCSTNPCMKRWAQVSGFLVAGSTYFIFLGEEGSLQSSLSPGLQVAGSEIWGPRHSSMDSRQLRTLRSFLVTSRSNVRRCPPPQRTLLFGVPTVDSASV